MQITLNQNKISTPGPTFEPTEPTEDQAVNDEPFDEDVLNATFSSINTEDTDYTCSEESADDAEDYDNDYDDEEGKVNSSKNDVM